MKTTLFIFSFLIFITTIWSNTMSQDSIPETKLTNEMSVLNEIIFLTFPSNAENSVRPTGIMAAQNSENTETRIVMDFDDQRFIIFATDLFAYSEDNLLDDIETISSFEGFKLYDYKNETFIENDSFSSVISTPTLFNKNLPAILINTLFIRLDNNHVIKVDAYINQKAYKNRVAFTNLSESIFKTIKIGTRKPEYKTRIEKQSISYSKRNLIVNLPNNYAMTSNSSYDFDVYNIQEVKSLTDTSFVRMTIYIGAHPSWAYKEYGFAKTNTAMKGKVFKKKMKYYYYSNEMEDKYLLEYQCKLRSVDRNSIMHIILYSSTYEDIGVLLQIAESINVKK